MYNGPPPKKINCAHCQDAGTVGWFKADGFVAYLLEPFMDLPKRWTKRPCPKCKTNLTPDKDAGVKALREPLFVPPPTILGQEVKLDANRNVTIGKSRPISSEEILLGTRPEPVPCRVGQVRVQEITHNYHPRLFRDHAGPPSFIDGGTTITVRQEIELLPQD